MDTVLSTCHQPVVLACIVDHPAKRIGDCCPGTGNPPIPSAPPSEPANIRKMSGVVTATARAATPKLGYLPSPSATVASGPPTASPPPQKSVQAFARATQTASAQAQEHQRLQKDLQARINELAAATG
jgi:hypothetical protein